MPPTREEIALIKSHKEDHLLPFLIYETGCRSCSVSASVAVPSRYFSATER